MKTRTRLRLTTAASIISAIVTILAIAFIIRQNDHDFQRSACFYEMEQKVYALNLLTTSYLLHPGERVKEQWHSTYRSLGSLLAELEVDQRHERRLLETIKADHQEVIVPFSQLISMQANDSASPHAGSLKEMLVNRIAVQLGVMLDNAGRLVESTQARISKSQRWASSFSILAVLLLAGLGVVLVLNANRFLKALMQLHDAAGHIKKEEWDYRIETKGNDEIAGFAQAFNSMSSRLGSSYAALQAEIAEKERAEDALRKINETLEQRVTERTAELFHTMEKLKHAHELTSAILDTVDGLVIVLDRQGGIVRFNAACERLTGWRSEEVTGRRFWEFLVPEEQQPGVIDTFDKLATGMFPSRHENQWICRDGSRRWMTWANSSLLDAEGDVEYVIGTGIDITERKRIEEELQQSRELALRRLAELESIYRSAHVALCVFDRDLRFVKVNDRMAEINGIAADEHIGKKVGEIVPDLADLAEQIAARIFHTGEPVLDIEFSGTTIDRPNIKRYWIEQWLPLTDSSGAITGINVVAEEVTEQRRSEETLRKSETRFKILSDTAGELLVASNPQIVVNNLCTRLMEHLDCHVFFNFLAHESGRLRLNACAGIPEEEARKIEWLDYGVAVCGCAARDAVRIVAEDIFNTPDVRTDLVRSYGIQAYACHPLMVQNQAIGTLSFGARTRTSFSPEELDLMKTVADQVAIAMQRMMLIEDLRKSRDELEARVQERTAELLRSNQALQDFAYIASHDLNEPLRKVISFGNILRQKHADSLGPTSNDYLKRMLDATQRMQSLLKSLLEYSRVNMNPEPFKEVDLFDIVHEVLSDLEVRIQKTGGEVIVGELPTIKADPSQMRQLFQNLIGNALKFHRIGEKPVVKVHCKSPVDSGCRIFVEDNGIGFDEQYSERIFEPFQRLHERSSHYEGTGIGLAICRKIVERHGGSISVTSQPGAGAKFMVSLPLMQA